MSKQAKQRALKIIQNRVVANMLGPGADHWGDTETELLSASPIVRYQTGILFPNDYLTRAKESKGAENEEEEDNEEENLELDFGSDKKQVPDSEKDEDENESESRFTQDLSTSAFYPDSIGLSFSVPKNTTGFKLVFKGGLYRIPKSHERKVPCSENVYNQIFGNNFDKLGLNDRLILKNGFMAIKEDETEESEVRDRHPLSEKVERYFKSIRDQDTDHQALQHRALLRKLVGRAYIRLPFEIEITNWKLGDSKIETPEHLFSEFPDLKLEYHVSQYEPDNLGNVHYRVQLINSSPSPLPNESSPQSPTLVSRCLFQSQIEATPLEGNFFVPYKTRQEQNPIDEEARELEFQYRSKRTFSAGHNVASEWKFEAETGNCNYVSTAWMPDTKVPSIRNDVEQTKESEKVLWLRNLCPTGLDGVDLFKSLDAFANSYAIWIQGQKATSFPSEKERQIASKITGRQDLILERIKGGIGILKQSPEALLAFRISSLAMMIQMLTGRSEDFGGKEKEVDEIKSDVNYNDLAYLFKMEGQLPDDKKPKYRPFQLAFLLLSIKGIVEPNSIDRQQIVDLVWFPTGGGKTEAYLALSAFVIAFRRMTKGKASGGTTILMRYTLRLLTAQQFERASRLICALEFLRSQREFEKQLGDERITIGLWVGQSTTPNSMEQVSKSIEKMEKALNNNADPGEDNKFQIHSCPWCGTKTYSRKDKITAFEKGANRLEINCLNTKCVFSEDGEGMPMLVFDEQIYREPPTLLFGTVDKFAQLAWKNESAALFGKTDNKLPPELIIQDELHLLSGPLGSMSALFEFIVDELCSSGGFPPKIVASTATTRNTGNQVKALYGKHRNVSVFPAPGLDFSDSYFAKTIPLEDSLRQYIGIMPTGKTGLEVQLQLLGTLLFARLEVLKAFSSTNLEEQGELDKIIDPYWTVLSYFNSLRDVGITAGKVGDEITRYTAAVQARLPLEVYSKGKLANYFNFNHIGLPERQIELTSRIDSSKIKGTLNELDKKWSHGKLTESDGRLYLNDVIDLVLATNMISVGIDVGRLNLMVINGMPRSTSEYIQASSRIARQDPGMAILLVSPMKARERSLYEHFIGFHDSFYKYVEPISATPFTEVTISKMSPTILAAWLRLVCGLAEDGLSDFDESMIEPIVSKLCTRFETDEDSKDWLVKTFKGLSDSIIRTSVEDSLFKDKFKRATEVGSSPGSPEEPTFLTLQSMREIAPEAWVKVVAKGRSKIQEETTSQ